MKVLKFNQESNGFNLTSELVDTRVCKHWRKTHFGIFHFAKKNEKAITPLIGIVLSLSVSKKEYLYSFFEIEFLEFLVGSIPTLSKL